MIRFDCDYMAGAHPKVLDALLKTNMLQTSGYGHDEFCDRAARLIREACGNPDAQVFLMVGGTQTNATVLDGLLPRIGGVISVESGHINVHEAGAVEFCGHKVITLPSHQGKMYASELKAYLQNFYADDTWKYMTAPGAVYISFPTEYGTIYSLQELRDIHEVAGEYNIPLYIDGARLGYGLAASRDVTLPLLSENCDVFYIGGTKMGTLFGEAVVCNNPAYLQGFESLMKAHGAILAKGRLLGAQFAQLFTDNLYMEIGRHGVKLAMELRRILESKGYRPFIDSPTNQQFFVLPNEVIDRISPQVSFEYWGPRGEKESRVRFVTSWETTSEDVRALETILPSSRT